MDEKRKELKNALKKLTTDTEDEMVITEQVIKTTPKHFKDNNSLVNYFCHYLIKETDALYSEIESCIRNNSFNIEPKNRQSQHLTQNKYLLNSFYLLVDILKYRKLPEDYRTGQATIITQKYLIIEAKALLYVPEYYVPINLRQEIEKKLAEIGTESSSRPTFETSYIPTTANFFDKVMYALLQHLIEVFKQYVNSKNYEQYRLSKDTTRIYSVVGL